MLVKRLTSRIGASCWAGIIFCVALGLVIIRSGENRHASAGQALQESALAAVAREQKPAGKSSAKLNPKARAMVAEAYGRLPLSFEVNHGQVDRNVRFLARGRDYAVFLTATEAVLSFQQHAGGCRSANVSEEAQPSQLLAGPSMHGVLAPALVQMRLMGHRQLLYWEGSQKLARQGSDLCPRPLQGCLSRHRLGLLRQPGTTGVRLCDRARR